MDSFTPREIMDYIAQHEGNVATSEKKHAEQIAIMKNEIARLKLKLTTQEAKEKPKFTYELDDEDTEGFQALAEGLNASIHFTVVLAKRGWKTQLCVSKDDTHFGEFSSVEEAFSALTHGDPFYHGPGPDSDQLEDGLPEAVAYWAKHADECVLHVEPTPIDASEL